MGGRALSLNGAYEQCAHDDGVEGDGQQKEAGGVARAGTAEGGVAPRQQAADACACARTRQTTALRLDLKRGGAAGPPGGGRRVGTHG